MMIVPQPFIAILAPGFYNDPQRLSLTVFFIRFTALIFLFQVLSSMQITLLQIFENFLPQIGINLFASASGVLVLALAGALHGATPTALALSALYNRFLPLLQLPITCPCPIEVTSNLLAYGIDTSRTT